MKTIAGLCKRYYYLLSAPLIYLTFPAFETPAAPLLASVAWFSLVPLMRYLRDLPLKKVFFASFGTGLLGLFLAFGWMGTFAGEIPYGNIFLLIPFIPTIAVIFATKFFLAELIYRHIGKGRFFVYPAVWVLIDYFQLYGNLAFPWIFWGNTQYAFTALIQMASVTGVLGVTFILIMANSALSQLSVHYPFTRAFFTKRENYSFFITATISLLIIGAGALTLVLNPVSHKGGYTVAQVQTCISPWEDWYEHRYGYMKDLISFTTQAAREEPLDLVVWNEATSLETLSYSYRNNSMNSYEYTIFQLAKHLRVPLLTGEIGQYENGSNYIYTNGAVLVNADGTLQKAYSKIHLAPIGETFPYGKFLPDLLHYLESMGASSFTPGTEPVVFSTPGATFGTLICYESLFPSLNRHYKMLGVDFLVNITNDGWSHFYSGHMQHYSGSPLRAVENGLYYVRCGNTGLTTVVDPYGRNLKSIPLMKKGMMIEHLDFSQNHPTVYARFGNIFLFCIAFVLVVLLIVTAVQKRGGIGLRQKKL